jgi:hypothetical protein
LLDEVFPLAAWRVGLRLLDVDVVESDCFHDVCDVR